MACRMKESTSTLADLGRVGTIFPFAGQRIHTHQQALKGQRKDETWAGRMLRSLESYLFHHPAAFWAHCVASFILKWGGRFSNFYQFSSLALGKKTEQIVTVCQHFLVFSKLLEGSSSLVHVMFTTRWGICKPVVSWQHFISSVYGKWYSSDLVNNMLLILGYPLGNLMSLLLLGFLLHGTEKPTNPPAQQPSVFLSVSVIYILATLPLSSPSS